jgi:hypothetical protein
MTIASTLMGSLGLTTAAHEEAGQGVIYERTIELGASVISIENIGSIRILDTKRGHVLTIFGGFLVLMGVSLFSFLKFAGLIVFLIGLGIIVWNLRRKLEVYLSIGTSDGQTTTIVSKEREFLQNLRDFLRRKIDTGSKEVARFDITNCRFFGPAAIGTDPAASTRQ